MALAREQLSELRGREVVIVGTGETSELTARALADSGSRTVFVANRRRDRASAWPGATAAGRSASTSCPRAAERADIVVAATASPHLLLEVRELAEVMSQRAGRDRCC